jgi:hypothetical protein
VEAAAWSHVGAGRRPSGGWGGGIAEVVGGRGGISWFGRSWKGGWGHSPSSCVSLRMAEKNRTAALYAIAATASLACLIRTLAPTSAPSRPTSTKPSLLSFLRNLLATPTYLQIDPILLNATFNPSPPPETPSWMNLGYWSSGATTYKEGCEALALMLGKVSWHPSCKTKRICVLTQLSPGRPSFLHRQRPRRRVRAGRLAPAVVLPLCHPPERGRQPGP